MRRGWLLVLPVLVLGAFGASRLSAAMEQDRCLDGGGAWYGTLGCEHVERRIDRIVIDKSERTLWAYQGDRMVRQFRVALGREPVGPKRRQGDGRTPEGTYPIIAHNPASAYHLSLRIGYPSAADRAAARAAGVSPGGDIMIHGLPNGQGFMGAEHVAQDWTAGCIALTNDEIEWLYAYTPDGAVVEIGA